MPSYSIANTFVLYVQLPLDTALLAVHADGYIGPHAKHP